MCTCLCMSMFIQIHVCAGVHVKARGQPGMSLLGCCSPSLGQVFSLLCSSPLLGSSHHRLFIIGVPSTSNHARFFPCILRTQTRVHASVEGTLPTEPSLWPQRLVCPSSTHCQPPHPPAGLLSQISITPSCMSNIYHSKDTRR